MKREILRRSVGILTLLLLTIFGATASRADVKYVTTSDWGTGFNGQITVTNTAATGLSDWTLEFDFAPTISSIWDAKTVSHQGTHYVVKSAGWNDVIAAGRSVAFGFGGSPGRVTAGPTNFVLRGTPTGGTPPTNPPTNPNPPTPAGISASITQTSGWSGGFGANLEIINGSSQAINGWTLKFQFTPNIQSLWNGILTSSGGACTVKNESWNGTIAPGARVTLGFMATGTLTTTSGSGATLNGAACPLTITVNSSNPGPTNPTGNSIVIGGGIDTNGEALQLTVPQGNSTFPLSLSKGGTPTFTVASNHPSVVTAQIVSGALRLSAIGAGRAGLRIQETSSGAVRFVGVRVRTSDGKLPGLPPYLALGSVSEDTDSDLSFWRGFDVGAKNRFVDARYIYLNGGPTYGWTTWTPTPGGRAVSYIRESKKMGMMPIFVWYNIPDGGENYTTDLEHIQSASYMQQYYQMLQLLTGILRAESPDDPVQIILEPDFLGYLAQNAGKPAAQIGARVGAAYDIGLLRRGVDPSFPDTVQGLVQSVNYLLSRDAPSARFGWQMNLWASPAGGWTTPVPGKGLMHLTDDRDVTTGRAQIYAEARAITQYYLDAGIKSYGASFVSIDKYGLDAATAEAAAASDPANSLWFWNNDQWTNYLTFVHAMHETSGLPVTLWQLPVGHINTSQAVNPYLASLLFPDLTNANRQGEDSAPTFFFGDTFLTSGKRLTFFSTNRGLDPALSVSGGSVNWGAHWRAAADAGVTMALFGAGVGGSTTNVGAPPTDGFWWITKAQKYLENPVPLVGR